MNQNQLPKLLVQTLDNLLADHTLTTWFVKGGSSYTQVSLRFNNMADDMNTEDMVYKRVSERRLNRDRERARNWQQDHESRQGYPIPTSNNVTLDVNAPPFQYGSPYTVFCPNIDQPTASSQSNPTDLEPTVETIPTSTNAAAVTSQQRQTIHERNEHIGDQYVAPQSYSAATPKQELGSTIVSEQYENKQDTANISPGIVEVICDECKGPCNADGNRQWWRCTICEDFDLCHKCQYYHFNHIMHLHEFTYPEDAENVPYCDSCGKVFGNNMTVHRCSKCIDYVLCQGCRDERMHNKHGSLKQMTLEEYLDSDGESDDSVSV